MSITDELRLFAADPYTCWVPTDKQQAELRAIADRIDAEHEKALAEQYKSLTVDMKPMTDENMAADGWIRLPVDADGEPIHVGDVMENTICPSVHREVTGVGAECFYGWDDGNGRYSQFDANLYRHHHAPTVEDVMVEFATDWESAQDGEDKTAVLKEYAKRLTLAGDAE